MLIGTYFASLGVKRRLAIPKKFRVELGPRPILAKWYEGCLILVSQESWEALLKRLTGKEEVITRAVRDTERFVLASAYELKIDAQGRVIIPSAICEYAGLKKETVFLGLGSRVEIWEKENWEKKEKLVAKDAAALLERMAKKYE